MISTLYYITDEGTDVNEIWLAPNNNNNCPLPDTPCLLRGASTSASAAVAAACAYRSPRPALALALLFFNTFLRSVSRVHLSARDDYVWGREEKEGVAHQSRDSLD